MTTALEPLCLVLAIAKNGIIGKDGKVPWNVPEDLKHFRRSTTGHAVIMGRKTWEEVGKPLPNRRNLVVSRRADLQLEGAEVAPSLEEAIALARTTDDEPRVIGGAEIYRLALPLATRVLLTEIQLEPEGDTHFTLDRSGFRETERRVGEDPRAVYVTLTRSPS
jgi:dihydrofolate reductase